MKIAHSVALAIMVSSLMKFAHADERYECNVRNIRKVGSLRETYDINFRGGGALIEVFEKENPSPYVGGRNKCVTEQRRPQTCYDTFSGSAPFESVEIGPDTINHLRILAYFADTGSVPYKLVAYECSEKFE